VITDQTILNHAIDAVAPVRREPKGSAARGGAEQAVQWLPYPGAGYSAGDFLAHFAGQTGATREAAMKNYAAMAR
jgi:hypothetical protein